MGSDPTLVAKMSSAVKLAARTFGPDSIIEQVCIINTLLN